jgi:hypothetical protein
MRRRQSRHPESNSDRKADRSRDVVLLNLVVTQAVRGAAGGCNGSVNAGWRAPIRRLSGPQDFLLGSPGQLGAGAPLD